MTPHDLAILAWDHRDTIVTAVLGILGWSAHPPAILVRLRRLPFQRAASVCRGAACVLDWLAGEVHSRPTGAPSALPVGAGPTTTTPTEQTP
jgi:hypothetical protein